MATMLHKHKPNKNMSRYWCLLALLLVLNIAVGAMAVAIAADADVDLSSTHGDHMDQLSHSDAMNQDVLSLEENIASFVDVTAETSNTTNNAKPAAKPTATANAKAATTKAASPNTVASTAANSEKTKRAPNPAPKPSVTPSKDVNENGNGKNVEKSGSRKNGRLEPSKPYIRSDICYKWERVRTTASEGFTPRYGHHAWLTADSGSILVFGGCDVPRGASRHLEHCKSDVHKLDLVKQTWQAMPLVGPSDEKIDAAMEGAAAAADPHSGILYIFGGRRKVYNPDSPQQVSFTNSLDMISRRRQINTSASANATGSNVRDVYTLSHLQTIGTPPPSMEGAQMVYGRAELIVFGGFSDHGFSNAIYTIPLQGNNALTWNSVKVSPKSAVPPARRGHTLTQLFPERTSGPLEFLLFGGTDGTKSLNDAWILKADNGVFTWQELSPFADPTVYAPLPRSGHTAVFQNGRVFIMGGCDTSGSPATCYDDVNILNLLNNRWEVVPESLAISNYAQGNSTTALQSPRAPSARRGATAIAVNRLQKLVILGGCTMTSCPGSTRALPTWQTRLGRINSMKGADSSNELSDDEDEAESGVSSDGTPRKLVDAGSVFVMNTDAICPTSCVTGNGAYVEETSEDPDVSVTNDNYIGPHCKCTTFTHGKFCQSTYECPNGCSGDKGECIKGRGGNYCKCKKGWWGVDCATAACRNNCNGRGVCTVGPNPLIASKTSVENAKRIEELLLGLSDQAKAAAKDLWMRSQSHCACREGFYGRDCSLERKPFSSHEDRCLNQCSGHGLCDATGKCQCQQGFSGDSCEVQCPSLCHSHGVCRADGICECREGFTGPDCGKATCPKECSKNGKCVDGVCQCAPGFGGRACQLATDCSGKGKFVDGKCVCKPGWGGETCSKQVVCEGGCGANGRCVEPFPSLEETRLLGKPVTTLSGPSLLELEVDISGKPKAEEAKVPMNPKAFTRDDPFDRPIKGTCQCVAGWRGKNCNLRACKHDCQNGFCSENGACLCYPGWKGEACTIPSPCPGNCTSSVHGICQATGTCQCQNGWGGPDCGVPGCPNNCSGNGDCRKGHCYCKKGFSGIDCSQRCENDCHGRGECVNGKCQCFQGFEGKDCNELSRCPHSLTSTLDCSGHGFCNRAEKKCLCEPGWKGEDCSVQVATCDANKCGKHGVCRNGRCYCDVGYSGKNCEIVNKCPDNCNGRGYCNFGRCHCYHGFEGAACATFVGDKTCPSRCSGNGFCMYGRCFCQDGFGGSDCSKPTGFCETTNCSNNGVCRFGKCFCQPGSSGKHCELGGCQPKCESGKGRCILGTCHCNPGFTGPSCAQALACPGNCSGKGVCILGSCACLPGFTGRDCSFATHTDPNSQICPDGCSGHGVCRDGKCICAPGYDGLNCAVEQEAMCPNNCSGDRGVCRYGKCFCKPGYSGAGCEKDLQCHPECYKNGVCMYGKCHCLPGFGGDDCKIDTTASTKTQGLSNVNEAFVPADPLDKELLRQLKQQEALGFMKNNNTAQKTSFLDTSTTVPPVADAASVFAVAVSSATGTAVEVTLPDALSSISKPCGVETHGCSQRGVCVNGKCQCELGFSGPDCSVVMGGQLWHRCPQACNKRGLCLFGKCYCDLGFGGPSCQDTVDISCKSNCSGNGICSFGKCHCMPGFVGASCETKVPCDVDCGAHGVCFRGRCICAKGYAGKNCQYPASIIGLDTGLSAKNGVDTTVFSGTFVETDGYVERNHASVEEEVSVVDSSSTSPNLIEVSTSQQAQAVPTINMKPASTAQVAIIPAAEETADLMCEGGCARGRCIGGRCYCEPGFAGQQCHIVADAQLVGDTKLAESEAIVELAPWLGDMGASHPLFVTIISVIAGVLVSYLSAGFSSKSSAQTTGAVARSMKKFSSDDM